MCEVFKVFVVPIILTFIFSILDKSCKTLCNRIFYDFYNLTGFSCNFSTCCSPTCRSNSSTYSTPTPAHSSFTTESNSVTHSTHDHVVPSQGSDCSESGTSPYNNSNGCTQYGSHRGSNIADHWWAKCGAGSSPCSHSCGRTTNQSGWIQWSNYQKYYSFSCSSRPSRYAGI